MVLWLFSSFDTVSKPEPGLLTLSGKPAVFPSINKFNGTVVWFFSPECPLCENYTLTIKELSKKYQGRIQFIGICPIQEIQSKQIEAYLKKYQLEIEVFRDPEKRFTKKMGATVTPEVFVLNQLGKTIYSGRIDNWAYAPGKTRQVTTSFELKETLINLEKDQNQNYSHKPAIGCFIE